MELRLAKGVHQTRRGGLGKVYPPRCTPNITDEHSCNGDRLRDLRHYLVFLVGTGRVERRDDCLLSLGPVDGDGYALNARGRRT